MAHMVRKPAPSRAWALAALCTVITVGAFALWPRARPASLPTARARVEAATPTAAIHASLSDPNRAEFDLLKAQVAGLRDQLLESERARQATPPAAEPSATPAPPPLEGPEVRARYDRLFDAPFPYSLVCHQRPSDGQPHPGYHLHWEFYPVQRARDRLKYPAGCERGAGTFLTDTLPEQSAAVLRSIMNAEL